MGRDIWTYLYQPPPLPSVHFTEKLFGMSHILIMTLRCEYKHLRKRQVTKECPDTGYDISVEEVK